MEKNLIRDKIRQKLKNLTSNEQKNAAQHVINCIFSVSKDIKEVLNNSKNVGCYWPTEYELDTVPIIKTLLQNKKLCYLPVVDHTTKTLKFIKYTNDTKLIKNKYGILEPELNIKDQLNVAELDVIFMPLVAFDSFGHRIGSGSGFYDRSLSVNNYLNCKLIGLAYSMQQTENFIPSTWDINLDFVVTEQHWLDFSKVR